MISKLKLTIFLAFFFLYNLSAQEADTIFQLRGKVKEFDTEIPLLGVNVYVADDPVNGTSTNKNGSFKLEVESLPVKVIISFIGYESDTIIYDNPNRRFKNVVLKPDIFILPGIEVTAKLKLERLSGKLYSIRDFLMLENEQVIYLKKEGDIRGWELVLATQEGVVLDTFSLKKRYIRGIDKLHLSCFGNIHLLTYAGAFQMNIEDDKLVLADEYSRSKFDRLVVPCVGESENYVYIKHKTYNGLAARFDIAHKEGLFRRTFKTVSDDQQLERYQEDAHYAALYENLEASGELELNSKLRNTFQKFQLEMSFRNRFFYNGIDIPLFQMEDSLVIFNYYDHKIQFFDLEGNEDISKEVVVDFHLNKKWEEVIFDKISNKIYAVFNSKKGKYISEIDLKTGEAKNPLHFECVFVRKIEVHADFLYLLHGEAHERNWVLYKVKF